MAPRIVPVHYLRANEAEWTPPTVICADTETRIISDDPVLHGLRLWVARRTDRRPVRGAAMADEWADGGTAAGFAGRVDAWCRGRRTVWLFCHNLSFDLAVSRLPVLLAGYGWEVTQAAVDGRSCWLTMGKGDKTLTLTDWFTWAPVALAEVGAAVGVVKPPLPDWDDSDDRWLHRCGEDVAILSEAVLQLMAWWDRERLGKWAVTGGACGWNAYRHRPTSVKVLIRPDPGQIRFGRSAVYGGRRFVWRHGKLPPGRYTEMDFAQAYATTAAHLPLPVLRAREFDAVPVDHPYLTSDRWGLCAEADIEADTPRWPVRAAGRVWYPVGRFRTILAGPDLAAAARLGALRAIGHGFVHQLAYQMAPWARWILDVTGGAAGDAPPVAKLACKHWGRAVIGKWAQHGYTRRRLGVAPAADWGYEHAFNHGTRAQASILDIGGWRFVSEQDGDSDNCYPEVLAWVEAYVRQALADVLDAAGPGRAVQCDTDGFIVADDPAWQAALASVNTAPYVLRAKRSYRHVEITGPQHIRLDDERRYSGVPKSATEGKDGRLHAQGWPKLAWQIRYGDPRGYVRPGMSYLVQPCYAPGWVLDDGAVVPVETTAGAGGKTVLLPWAQTRWAAAGRQLGAAQSPALKGLWSQ